MFKLKARFHLGMLKNKTKKQRTNHNLRYIFPPFVFHCLSVHNFYSMTQLHMHVDPITSQISLSPMVSVQFEAKSSLDLTQRTKMQQDKGGRRRRCTTTDAFALLFLNPPYPIFAWKAKQLFVFPSFPRSAVVSEALSLFIHIYKGSKELRKDLRKNWRWEIWYLFFYSLHYIPLFL